MLKVFAISSSKVVAEAVKVAVGMRYLDLKDQVMTTRLSAESRFLMEISGPAMVRGSKA